MKRTTIVGLVLASVLLAGCGDDDTAPSATPATSAPDATDDTAGAADDGGDGLEVTMTDAEGAEVGTVTLTPEGSGVRVEADLENLEPGFHGFHIHAVGLCEADAPDGPFTTAKGHYVGGGGTHGDHAGDLPSLYVTEDGSASLTATLDTFTLDELTADDGAAVMIHAGPDNFANIPDRYTSSEATEPGPDEMTNSTGDAGARAACGVIEPGAGTG